MWNRLIEGIYILHQVVALNINYSIYIQYILLYKQGCQLWQGHDSSEAVRAGTP